MPLPLIIPLKLKRYTNKMYNAHFISEAKQKMQAPSFSMDFVHMKLNYAHFMNEQKEKMVNFYSDWDVNAVKGLLQTGRFSKYADDILEDLLSDQKKFHTWENNAISELNTRQQPIRKYIVGVVAPPCAGKSTTVEANADLKDCLVLDGGWLIGSASRLILGNKRNEKFRFNDAFGEHTYIKHVHIVEEMLPKIFHRVNLWLDKFEYEMNKKYDEELGCKGKGSFYVLIFHSNPKIFQFLNIPIYSAVYCNSKAVLRTHVEQRHQLDPFGWIDIRLDWFYQCNVQATVALEKLPSKLRKDLIVYKVYSNKQLETRMSKFPDALAQRYKNNQDSSQSDLVPIEKFGNANIILKQIIMSLN